MKKNYKIGLAEAKQFSDLFKQIYKIIDHDIILNINKDNIHLIEMDGVNVAMVDLKLFDSGFVEYDIKEDTKVGLDFDKFIDILKTIKKDDYVNLKSNGNKLSIEKINSVNTTFNIPYMDLEDKHRKIPDLNFNARIEMPTKLFKSILSNFKKKDTITIEVENKKASFSNKTINIPIEQDLEVEIINNTKDKIKSKYSYEYLKNIVNTISEYVVLEFDNEYPLRLSFEKKHKFRLSYILAPRLYHED